jgi:DNA-binding NarL/FixJ family response regulator
MRPSPSVKRKTRILIADREAVFRLGLKKLLSLEDDLRVVAEAEAALQLPAMTECFKPEVLFLQAEILAEEASNLLAEVGRTLPRSRIVVTASTLAEGEGVRYVQAGASGVILRSADPKLFVKCVRKVIEGEVWLPKRHVAEMAKHLEVSPRRSVRPVDTLTRREKSVISYLMQGWRNREIAKQLSITEQTVKNHLRIIYDKVGVSDRLELVLYVIHQRLDLPPVEPLASGT